MTVVKIKKVTKGTKKCAWNFENCLETNQLQNKINHLEKNKIAIVLKNIITNSWKTVNRY